MFVRNLKWLLKGWLSVTCRWCDHILGGNSIKTLELEHQVELRGRGLVGYVEYKVDWPRSLSIRSEFSAFSCFNATKLQRKLLCGFPWFLFNAVTAEHIVRNTFRDRWSNSSIWHLTPNTWFNTWTPAACFRGLFTQQWSVRSCSSTAAQNNSKHSWNAPPHIKPLIGVLYFWGCWSCCQLPPVQTLLLQQRPFSVTVMVKLTCHKVN